MFDLIKNVLLDIDGVLWQHGKVISGTKQTIDFLESALVKADFASALASNFNKNYNEFTGAAEFNSALVDSTLNGTKQIILEERNRYKEFCG